MLPTVSVLLIAEPRQRPCSDDRLEICYRSISDSPSLSKADVEVEHRLSIPSASKCRRRQVQPQAVLFSLLETLAA